MSLECSFHPFSPLQDEVAALDAVGTLSQSREGAELLLSDPVLAAAVLERALGRWGDGVAFSGTRTTGGTTRRTIGRTTGMSYSVLVAESSGASPSTFRASSPSPSVRVAALHALALAAGVQRAHEGRDRGAALLSHTAEQTLRVGVYEAAACGSAER